MLDRSLSFTTYIDISASPTEVWDTLVNPDTIREYFFGTETITDWTPGSEIIFQGDFNGQPYRDKGVVTEFIPEKRLKYQYWSAWSGLEDKPENYQSVMFILDHTENGTQLTLSQEGFADKEKLGHAEQMWPGVLDNIKKISERE